MADRVYPSVKPAGNGTTTAAGTNGATGNPTFPANKAQLYNASRPAYRPTPRPRRSRSCCCSCCLWTTLTILVLIFLAALASAVVWVLYRPHRPDFAVSSLQFSQFNLTSSNQLTSRFNVTVTARNPNKRIQFFYDPISISMFSEGVSIGEGTVPGFVHRTKNSTVLRATVSKTGQSVEGSALRSDLKNKKSLPLKIQLDTKVKVKIGALKTKKVGVRITCKGIKASIPTGRSSTTATTSGAKCKVDLRIKIWNWTV